MSAAASDPKIRPFRSVTSKLADASIKKEFRFFRILRFIRFVLDSGDGVRNYAAD